MFVSINLELTQTPAGLLIAASDDAGRTGQVEVPIKEHHSTCLVLLDPPVSKTKHTVKRLKQVSIRQEESIARSHGGKRHRGSGNQPGYAGDVRVDGVYRIEAKFRTARRYTVTRDELDKIRSECALGEVPLFFIDFKNPGTLRTEDSWVLVPRTEWEKKLAATNNK